MRFAAAWARSRRGLAALKVRPTLHLIAKLPLHELHLQQHASYSFNSFTKASCETLSAASPQAAELPLACNLPLLQSPSHLTTWPPHHPTQHHLHTLPHLHPPAHLFPCRRSVHLLGHHKRLQSAANHPLSSVLRISARLPSRLRMRRLSPPQLQAHRVIHEALVLILEA